MHTAPVAPSHSIDPQPRDRPTTTTTTRSTTSHEEIQMTTTPPQRDTTSTHCQATNRKSRNTNRAGIRMPRAARPDTVTGSHCMGADVQTVPVQSVRRGS